MGSVLEQRETAVRRTDENYQEERTAIWPEDPAIPEERTDGANDSTLEEQP